MSTHRVVQQESRGFHAARQLASRVIARWQNQRDPSARAALRCYPQLMRYRSVTLDLAYEEYCLREESGEDIDTARFCNQFPSVLDSLERRIALHLLLGADSQPAPEKVPATWPVAGDVLQGYRIVGEIGRGSFARVYRAHETRLGNRLVAIKVCHRGASEADTLGRVQHPSIVPVHSVSEDGNGWTVICMPLLGTETLANLFSHKNALESDSSQRRAIARWIVPVSRALAHAHQLGVWHLDLKPANILVTHDQRPMLLDFNLSANALQHTHKTGGTLPYMSPEQLTQLLQPSLAESRVDARSDIFSLGVILYELLEGRLPWDLSQRFSSLVEMGTELQQRQQQVTPAMRETATDLCRVTRRCLAIDPDDRFPTMQSLVRTLEDLTRFRLRRTLRQHRRCLLGLAATLTVTGFSCGIRFTMRKGWSELRIHEGEVAMNHGQFSEAIDHFSTAMRDPSTSRWARVLRGVALARRGDDQAALADLKEGWQVYQADELALLIGDCYRHLSQPRKALSWYRRGITHGPTHWPALVNMAHAAMALGDHTQATRWLDLAENAGASGHIYWYARLLNCHWSFDDRPHSHQELAHWAGQLAQCRFTEPQAHIDLAYAFLHLERDARNLELACQHVQAAMARGAQRQRLLHDPQLKAVFKTGNGVAQSQNVIRQPLTEPLPELAELIAIERTAIERQSRVGNSQ